MKTAPALRSPALRVLALAAALALPALPAHAGPWKKAGEGYAIQVASFDLDQPAGRQTLLQTVEYLARKVCIAQTSLSRVSTCQREMVASAIANADSAVQQAVHLAQIERKGIQQATR